MPNRLNRQHTRLQLQPSTTHVAFDPFKLPAEAYEWQDIFDLLAPCQLAILGGVGAQVTCEHVLCGALQSLDNTSFITFPQDGYLTIRYIYGGGSSAHFRLQGFLALGQASSFGHVNFDVSDSHWIFLRYLAQREARSQKRTCQLCGKPFGFFDSLAGRWHHAGCSRYQIDQPL